MFERDSEASTSRPSAKRTAPESESSSTPIGSQLLGLQRAAGNASVASFLQRQAEDDEPSPVRELMGSGGGRPLDPPVKEFMESRIGADFSDVRIHTGAKATEAAQSVQAHAYTVGTDVVFQDGQYNPSSSDGQKMLAHELTHVVQQRSGPVDGTPAAGGISISDPWDRFERAAEQSAERVMAGGPTEMAGQPASGLQRQSEEDGEVQTSAVQRQEAPQEDQEELQMSSVQRQEAGELEEEEDLQTSALQRQEAGELEQEEELA